LRTSADHGWWNEIVSEKESKPIFDEQTLAQVLEAAYVMQEHNRELQKTGRSPKLAKNLIGAERWSGTTSAQPQPQPRPTADSGFSLAQIVDIQHLVQVRHLGLQNVMELVVERLTQIARVGGASIGILDDKTVQYRATAGIMALPAGTEIFLERALCLDCIRAGSVFRCTDVNTERILDKDECRRRGIQAMIAVPIFHRTAVAGSLELFFSRAQAFTEEDVHACQLMAGLVTEALARDEEFSWKKSLADDRAAMLEALEKLKPELAALVDTRAAKDLAAMASAPSKTTSASAFVCPKCGHELIGEEHFCGNCGSPRSSDYEASNLQSKVASFWHMQQAMKNNPDASPANGAVVHQESPATLDEVKAEEPVTDLIEPRMSKPAAFTENLPNESTESTDLIEAAGSADFENAAHSDLEVPLHTVPEEDVEAPEPTALVKSERGATWTSAATTLDFFQRLAAAKNRGLWAEFWNTRRGDIYLAIAVVLMLGVMRWAIWSSHSVSATGSPTAAAHHRAAPDADLSLFDRILIKLGVAEAPDPPQYKGNPRTQVWVDLHTALYYCPGADLYGKTPKGRFSSQREAQLDQFEPAYRKACD
jgi:putative methionine-R-sulfoxide reductase with GAF domain/predicted RNA-binding Zn-ribbon protein involved in translation (DUF1610 family)